MVAHTFFRFGPGANLAGAAEHRPGRRGTAGTAVAQPVGRFPQLRFVGGFPRCASTSRDDRWSWLRG